MRLDAYLDDLFTFIGSSPTAFHAVRNGAALLEAAGFRNIRTGESWSGLVPGGYYTTRNGSSLIAFFLRERSRSVPLRMAGAHTDSPGLKVKPLPLRLRHNCLQLGVEVYGSPLLASWLDRDLSLAGRVCWCRANGPLECGLIDCRRPVAIIPSLAIHLDREANSGRAIDRQAALLPLLLQSAEMPELHGLLKKEAAQIPPDAEILAFDLFLYDPQGPRRIGLNGEFISGPRLDNLISCHALLRAMVDTPHPENVLLVLNDHEEVGSLSETGAQGSFLRDVLGRLYPDQESRQQVLATSLLISADNAHAVHPNFPDRHDPEHQPLLNGGPVIKFNASQRYATGASGAALFRRLCARLGIPCQSFVMRNDLPCGSTIGPMTSAALGVATVDVGVPQLAMHSIRETAGSIDCQYLFKVLSAFFRIPDKELSAL